jgi:enolase
MKITKIHAREILASGGEPSVEVDVILESGVMGRASVSYGVSAGSKEACVLLDDDKFRYNGKGMLKAVANVNDKIAAMVVGKNASDQRGIDELMIKADGTENKSNLGANAILGVSMAVCRAAAAEEKLELYQYLRQAYQIADKSARYTLPKPLAVFIEGGKHADNSTDLQEYILAVTKEQSARENVRMMEECYKALKKILKQRNLSTNVGNEGAFAPEDIANNELPLELITEAISAAGYKIYDDAGIYIDAAASEFYKDGKYHLATENKVLTAEELIELYLSWQKKYPIICWEDMLSEFDWEHWPILLARSPIPLVADDLTVTNVKLWQKAIDMKAANAILIKLNQAGTVTETVDCCLLANKYNYFTVPSHRGGGETNDSFLVDLAAAVGSKWIKVGPSRGERVAKYNRLMEIEEELNYSNS